VQKEKLLAVLAVMVELHPMKVMEERGESVNPGRVLAEEARVQEGEPQEAVGGQAMELVEEQSGRGYQLPLHQGTEVEAKALRLQVLAEEAQVREGEPRESVGGQAMELEGEHRKQGADQGVVA
jgi:hypothetical protein